jgi:hypothetical protein
MNRVLPNTNPTINPARVLRDAACYLDRNGWIRGALFADDQALEPAACAMGAIAYVVTGHPIDVFNRYTVASTDEYDAVVATASVLAQHLDRRGLICFTGEYPEVGVEDWNDRSYRCEFEVVEELLWAADWYEHNHGQVSQ